MHHHSYRHLLRALSPQERRGPIVLMLLQDDLAVARSVAHYRAAGIDCILGLGPARPKDPLFTHSAPYECHRPGAMAAATNALIKSAPGTWVVPCWNGELLYWPHGDTRPLPDLFAFLDDERRRALGGVVLDAYPAASGGWQIDRMGYEDRATGIFGGLRQRIGAACPAMDQRLDRPLAVKTRPGLRVDPQGLTNDDTVNDRHTTWHHSPAGALVSLRVWAWLAAQPDFIRRDIPMTWPGSVACPQTAADFWELGFIEPGQWV